eukprot:scaffold10720_cov69-Phaeocystis_antarctica.AAC.15
MRCSVGNVCTWALMLAAIPRKELSSDCTCGVKKLVAAVRASPLMRSSSDKPFLAAVSAIRLMNGASTTAASSPMLLSEEPAPTHGSSTAASSFAHCPAHGGTKSASMHAATLYLARAGASLNARAEVARPHIAAASSDGACSRVKADAAEASAPMSSATWPRSVSKPNAADCARRLRCTASMSTISCEEHAPSAMQSPKPSSDLASAQSDARSRAASPPASSVVVPCKLSAARAISANASPRSSSSSSSITTDTAATATDRRAEQMAAAASATSSW